MHALEVPLRDDDPLLLPADEDWNLFSVRLVRTRSYWQAVLKSFVVLQAPSEGAPGELAGYLSVVSAAARASRGERGAALTVELDADGCHGRWVHFELPPDGLVVTHLCAQAVAEGAPGAELWLWEEGWRVSEETWQRTWHAEELPAIAEGALLALIRTLGLFTPSRAYLRADLEVSPRRWRAVDLRAAAVLLGRPEPPAVRLPASCSEAAELRDLGLEDHLLPEGKRGEAPPGFAALPIPTRLQLDLP